MVAKSLEAAFLDDLRDLREVYAQSLPAKIEVFAAAWDTLRSGWDDDALESTHRLAHQFNGSGAMYGFPELSESARVLEAALKDITGAGPSGAERERIGLLVDEVKQAARSAWQSSVDAP